MLFTLALLISAAATEPATYVLRSEMDVWDVAVADMNGDGNQDVLVLSCDAESHPLKKALLVFLASPESAYAEAPSATLSLDPRVGALQLAEVDGAPPREVVAFDAAGATVYHFADGAFTPAATPRFSSLMPSGGREPLFLKEAEDINGDGIDEWLIPQADGFAVRHSDRVLKEIECDVVSEIRRNGSIYVYHRLPATESFDHPGTSVKGLAFLSDEFADFAYGDNWEQTQRFKVPVNLEEKWEASAQMKDIDKNGFPDLLVTQTRGTVNIEVLTQLYLADGAFSYPEQPTAAFSTKGSIASPALIDVDGDEHLDMVFIRIPFGVKNLVNFFVRGKVSVEADVYLFNEGYPAAPNYTTTLSLDAPDGREQVAYTMGDFNEDGRLDVAFGLATQQLVIHTGEADKFVSNKPWKTFSLPSFGNARSEKLNANEAADIIILHPGGDNAQRVEVVVF
jgi:hypothetical protein